MPPPVDLCQSRDFSAEMPSLHVRRFLEVCFARNFKHFGCHVLQTVTRGSVAFEDPLNVRYKYISCFHCPVLVEPSILATRSTVSAAFETSSWCSRPPDPPRPLARIPRWERRTAPVRAKSWRSHGAACAVALRSAKRILEETREPARVARARNALARRTRAARLVFCSLDQADVMACLRTMDLFGVQFAEVVGERKEVGDTSKNAKAFVTLQHWPDVRSCQVEMREASFHAFAQQFAHVCA